MSDTIDIVNERVFPVGRQVLFDAFADPRKLSRWWGPHDFTNTITAFDLCSGGTWLITMTASDGSEFHNRWSFQEVVPGSCVKAYHHEPMHAFSLAMTFTDDSRGARLAWHMQFDRTDENAAMERFVHAANEQNFDRLEALLQDSDADL